eukprot:TRINITY_DN6540_c0_g1_i3.p1 TRINITY_DN6540_c0_g1~~TRINITY_DN6540_c0_g1_i3.p1  ORF type:complete len:519 (-),score=117.67 TRINITY_DN6540_c0_g1_i3:427-1983(-)
MVAAAGSELEMLEQDEWREEWKPIVGWLTELGLEKLIWNFIDAGYTDLDAIKSVGLTSDDWRYLKVTHPVHRQILKAGKRMPIEYDKYGNPYFVEEQEPSQLASENAQLLMESPDEATRVFRGMPEFVPCAVFCGAHEGYIFTTRRHNKSKSREERWEDFDDKGQEKKEMPTVTARLTEQLQEGRITGYYKDACKAAVKTTLAVGSHEFGRSAFEGRSLRQAMSLAAVLYDPKLQTYSKRKLKVYLRYESWKPGVLAENMAMRSAVRISEKWLDVTVEKLTRHYVGAFNSKHPEIALPVSDCMLAIKDKSVLLYSKIILPPAGLIGDCLGDGQEVFVMTKEDMARQLREVQSLTLQLEDHDTNLVSALTITREQAAEMSTIKEEIDETVCHALLVGLGSTYALPVEPSMRMADIKLFISVKSGLPLNAIDLATATKHQEIENDIDLSIVPDEETCEEHSRRVNGCTITGPGIKTALCLCYGIRIVDPVYGFRVPTAHLPGSFQGEPQQQSGPQPGFSG